MTNSVGHAWVGGAAVVGLAMAALVWQFQYSPRMDEVDEVNEQTEALEVQAAQIEIEHLALAKEQERLPESKQALADLREAFPTSVELKNFTLRLGDLAEATGAQVNTINVPPEALPIGEAAQFPERREGAQGPQIEPGPPGLYGYKFEVEITGTLAQAKDYLKSIQEQEARTALVTNLSWTNDSTDSTDESAAAFTIDGFVYALVPTDQLPSDEEN